MRRAPARGTALVLAIVSGLAEATCAAEAARPKGENYALLVGIRKYNPVELRSLPYPESDVVELASVLRENGYKPDNVVVMTEAAAVEDLRFLPTADRIRKELALLIEDRDEEDVVIVALAGHGVQFRGDPENYFCPADARLTDRSTLISLGEVYKALEHCPAAFKLLLVDACRNDPVANVTRARDAVALESVTRPQAVEPPGGVAALFSCSAGERAFENDSLKHGVFFNFVIEGLRGAATTGDSDGVTLPELELFVKRRVRDFVRAKYGERQMPELVGRSRGLAPVVLLDRALPSLRRGTRLINEGRFTEALVELDAAIQHDSRNVTAYCSRSKVQRSRGALEDAIGDANEAIRLDPKSAIAYSYRGHAYNDKKDYEHGIADYTEAIRLDPKYYAAYGNRGDAYEAKGDLDRAIADYSEQIRLEPSNALGYCNRAKAYHRQREFDRAIADCEEAIRLDRTVIGAYLRRAAAYKDKAQPDRAIADYTEAIRLDPKNAIAYNSRGVVADDRGDLDRATADYTQAIQLNPKYAAAYRNRGFIWYRKAQPDRAIADCDAAIRLDPRDALAYRNRAAAHARKGDYDRAIADCDRAIALNPHDGQTYIVRGRGFQEKRAFDRAIAEFSKAISFQPKNALLYRYRSECYKKMGDAARAKADHGYAVYLDPNVDRK